MREGRREAEIEEGKEGSRDRGREEGTQRWRKGRREAEIEGGKEGSRDRGREGGKQR